MAGDPALRCLALLSDFFSLFTRHFALKQRVNMSVRTNSTNTSLREPAWLQFASCPWLLASQPAPAAAHGSMAVTLAETGTLVFVQRSRGHQ